MEATPRRIALVGTATTSVHDAPYNDPAWEIWNISGNFIHNKRFDLWFDVHTPEVIEAARTVPQYFEFLKNAGNKLMVIHPSERWPEARLYPLDKASEKFGEYFTSSLSYMLAYAFLLYLEGENIAQIGLWGCDLAVDGEYAHQRPCVEYYLGIFRGAGIPISIAPESPLLRCAAPYGTAYLKLSREMTQRLCDAKIEADQKRIASLEAEKQFQYAAGKRDAILQICQYWNL